MPLVLANTTSLWKQISTRPMQSPLPSFIFLQSHSGLTAGTALTTVHHTPCCLSYSPCLLKDACLYLSHLLQSIIPERVQSPGQRPFLMMCFWHGILPLYWYLQTQVTEEQPLSSCKGDGDLSWTHFQVSAESWEILLTSTRACMEGLKSLYSSSSGALQKFVTLGVLSLSLSSF